MNNKTTPTTIDEYAANFPTEIQSIPQKIRQIIQDVAPHATESISYGMPTFSLNSKHFIYFAAWKKHISIYPIYGEGGDLKEELAPYRKEKDSLHFPPKEPFPYDLVRKIVRMKLEEHTRG